MFQLVYASSAARPLPPSRLNTLLERARPKNRRLGVTSLLLYRNPQFLQVIEGSEQAVRGLYDTIRADERHTAVISLRERLIDARDFPDWQMGFVDLERARIAKRPGGPLPFMNGQFTRDYFRENTCRMHQSLLQFRDAVLQ